jgi:hypothetical protein
MGGVDEHFVGHCKSREERLTVRSAPLGREGRAIRAFVDENGWGTPGATNGKAQAFRRAP